MISLHFMSYAQILIQYLFLMGLIGIVILPALVFRKIALRYGKKGWVYFLMGFAVGFVAMPISTWVLSFFEALPIAETYRDYLWIPLLMLCVAIDVVAITFLRLTMRRKYVAVVEESDFKSPATLSYGPALLTIAFVMGTQYLLWTMGGGDNFMTRMEALGLTATVSVLLVIFFLGYKWARWVATGVLSLFILLIVGVVLNGQGLKFGLAACLYACAIFVLFRHEPKQKIRTEKMPDVIDADL
jgi:hypothetical protein